uniref:RRM domain-containing protein n=1 Tax=Rhodosorus marinus TaxID=101924 RepID=A0A7S0G711_9RHOD|mmetsp:Transcript_4705/g.6512  ORF Transcript_4705/g.6512 Transcript_4705/m.6512 type:complete len:149 (+) Transcript_4705:244-690(+)
MVQILSILQEVSVVVEFQSPEKARIWRSSLRADYRGQAQLLPEREARQIGKSDVPWIRLDNFREETRMSTIQKTVYSIVTPLHIFFDCDDSGKYAIIRLASTSEVELAHRALNEMYIDGRMVVCTKDSEHYNALKDRSHPAAKTIENR